MEIEPIPIRIKMSRVDWAVFILFQIPFVVALMVRCWVGKVVRGYHPTRQRQ